MKPRIKRVVCAGVQYVSRNVRSLQSQTAGFVSLSRSWAKNNLVKQMGKWEAGITRWAKWKFLGNLNCRFKCFLWNENLFSSIHFYLYAILMIFYCNLDDRRFWYFGVLVYAFQAFAEIDFPEIDFFFLKVGFLSTRESNSLISGHEFC